MQREQVHHHGIETDPLVSIFQVSDTTYFYAKLKCQCCNGGLKFVLLEHIHNAQVCECQSNNEHVSLFNRRHTAFELGKPLKNLCSSHCLPSKSYFKHAENFSSV